MEIEKFASLIWRFVGVLILLSALPGVVMLLSGVLAGIGSIRSNPYFFVGHLLPALFVSVQVIVGLVVLRFSGRMGRMIARGL
jgi:hypothetical protein